MAILPLAPGDHAVRLNGTLLRYHVAGTGPLLFMQAPGWGIGAEPYIATFDAIETTSTVVYIRPRGSSGAPVEPTRTLQVGQFVEDLEALRAHLGQDTIRLAGHSHGGLIAMHYALRHPDRLLCLLLLDAQLVGMQGLPGERDGAVDPAQVPAVAAAFAYLERSGGFQRMFEIRTDAEATDFLRGIAPLYFVAQKHTASLLAMLDKAPLPVHTLQAVSGTDAAFPIEEAALLSCKVPVLAVSGRYDIFCPPSAAARLTKILPKASHIVFEDSGHFPWLEEPRPFLDAVQPFLDAHVEIPAR